MKRKSNCFVTILFLIYLALLVWIILFKLQFSISDLDKIRSINLIPFHYDKEIGAAFHLTEVLENFLIFVPMGIYLQMLLPRTKLYVKFMLIAGTSFLLETMQYILAVGRSDITDVLTNTVTGADRGTAYHRLLECLDYRRAYSIKELMAQTEELVAEGKMTKVRRRQYYD